ncbi:MAG: hypothetical protein QGF03_01135 [SAR324 cluster bacterium]|nr:hypothetical protein [SAR324 cluster bacterium]MDP7629184.1 hypothetical protein [SAR324 cluster bacterium]
MHRSLTIRMLDMLQTTFPDASVSGNICLYYEEGNPKKMISPDTLWCRLQPPAEKRGPESRSTEDPQGSGGFALIRDLWKLRANHKGST